MTLHPEINCGSAPSRGARIGSARQGLSAAYTRVRCVVLVAALAVPAWAAPLSSRFTYQGSLELNGAPVDGNADMRFSLWTAAAGGVQVDVTPALLVNVSAGLFTQDIDFGYEAFDGEDVFLEIEVRFPAGGGAWNTLAPRQRIAATPYALQTRGLFVDDDLNVGIGTTAPASTLHVDGDIRTTGVSQVRMYNGGNIATVLLDGDPDAPGDNGGRVALHNNNGTETVSLAGSQFNGHVSLQDGAGTVRAEMGANPAELALYSNGGARIARLWGDAGGDNGTLDLFSDEDGLGVRMYATPFGGGFIETYQADGDRAFRFEPTNTNSGALAWLYDRNERVSMVLNADSGSAGGARIGLHNLANNETVELLAGGNNNGGNVYVRNNAEETTVELRGDEGGQNSGFIGILNRTGTNDFNAVAMDALDEFDTGARMLMRCSDGSTTVELDAEDGGHGEIALWDCAGNRTFRVFGNTMTIYDNNGNATWSINGNGAKNAIVQTPDYGQRLVYTVESPEVWFEDIGSAQLENGVAVIQLDPVFLQTVTVSTENPIRVFITLTDACTGVYVEKHFDHFVVRELAGNSNATFDYRVMAKRVGFEQTRLEPFIELSSATPDSDEFRTPRPKVDPPPLFEPETAPAE